MANNVENEIVLIGSGTMAEEYAKVLRGMGKKFVVIGRGETSALRFESRNSCEVFRGGIDKYLQTKEIGGRKIIVSVNVDQLAFVSKRVIEAGAKELLLEKPGGLDAREIESVAEVASKMEAYVALAYNRRFYASTLKAKEIIAEDGGVDSFSFEFTEWSHEIEKLTIPKAVKENWLLANSSHVIDLAFYLGGWPEDFKAFVRGSLPWHSAASSFAGSGKSSLGALFSYQANWDAPGRWGVEVLTKNRRLIFRPLEKLQLQMRGSVAIDSIQIDDSLEKEYKPGLFLQVKDFVQNERSRFASIQDQAKHLNVYDRICGK